MRKRQDMKRTTILADEALLLEAKYLAIREGMTFTSLVQEALAEYLAAHRVRSRLEFIGMGHSGDGTIAQQAEEILGAEIDPIQGWSLHSSGAHADVHASEAEA
jgi:hypothetical protein